MTDDKYQIGQHAALFGVPDPREEDRKRAEEFAASFRIPTKDEVFAATTALKAAFPDFEDKNRDYIAKLQRFLLALPDSIL